ncbi:hypothetical protein M405DRAFT_99043 [Rhizopogon salebrosus TDB-379]|nr:hypothetical protein M405DRAFT_99043 [Rhizopogon salebrosus TDB-379]
MNIGRRSLWRRENGLVHLEMLKKHYKELEKAYEVCMYFFCSSRKSQRTRWCAKCTPAVSKKTRSMWVWRRKAEGVRGREFVFQSCARLLRVSASFSMSLLYFGSASFHWCSYMVIRWI